MSLVMMALRRSAVEAIKAADTLVGNNVLNSKIAAIDVNDGKLSSDQEQPFVAVYTDAAKGPSPPDDATGYRHNGVVTLVVNFGVSLSMSETNKETGETIMVTGVPATDEAFEATLDTISCQASRALSAENSPWAELFRRLVRSIKGKQQIRQSSANDGARLACGQIRFDLEVIPDPLAQQVAKTGSLWQDFMALLIKTKVPEIILFQKLLSAKADSGLYAHYVEATGMAAQDVAALKLHPVPFAHRETRIIEPKSDAKPC